MSTTPSGGFSAIDAFTAVGESFSSGWQRMGWLLFTGPNVSLVNWLTWGLILFVAAPGGGGGNPGSQWSNKVEEGDFQRLASQIEPWMIAAALAVFALIVVFSIVWLYFQSRFRLLMLEGVQSGVPRIRGVFGRTGRDGLRYFLLEIGLIVAFFLLAIPTIVAWFPFVMGAIRGNIEPAAELVIPIVFTAFWLIPVAIALGLVRWWVYDLALPYVVFGRQPFGEAMGRAWTLTKARPGAVILLLITRFLVAAVAYCCVVPVAVLCTCLLWGPPAALAIPFVALTIAAPLAAILTVPIVLVLGFVMVWIITTLTAPIPLFFRSWSCAFVNQLDPQLPLWAPMYPPKPAGSPAPPAITPPETS
jgi:hypothetical protein